MAIDFIEHKGRRYPSHEAEGNAAQWIMPLAKRYCVGKGLDVGYSKEAWMFPGAIGIEPTIDPNYHAMRLPGKEWDYIFSSHCLEHVQRNWYDVIDYWLSKIRIGGILFLYLPHSSQTYWHPSSNRKHIHSFDGSEIEMYLNDLGHKVYVSGCDWNHSFVVVCEKIDNSGDALKRCANAILKLQEQDRDILPSGHYPVKESLLYGDVNNAKLKDPNKYNAGDRISQIEYIMMMGRPFYSDRFLFEDDTKPEDFERHYIITAIKR